MPPIIDLDGLPFPDAIGMFCLAFTAIAGLLGGEEAILAMSTIHFYQGRRWLGFYNAPGSLVVMRYLDKMGITGSNGSAACSLALDEKGPEYIASLSGTRMKSTGPLAHLMMDWSKKLKPEGDPIGERTTKHCHVAYLAVNHIDYDVHVQSRAPPRNTILGVIPIIVSASTCIVCLLSHDWFSFAAALIGMACGGWTSFLVGKGWLMIKSVKNPSPGAPPGHGILKGEDDLMVIKGTEQDVNAVTKGFFILSNLPRSTGEQDEAGGVDHSYRWYTNTPHPLFFFAEFFIQLFLISQGKRLGQLSFIISLAVSWLYNRHLSLTSLSEIQRNMVARLGGQQMHRFCVGTWTTTVVFACLLLFHGVERGQVMERERNLRKKFLRSHLLNNTAVWDRWTDKVVEQLLSINDHQDSETQEFPFLRSMDEDVAGFDDDEKRLFNRLLSDAAEAFGGYFRVREDLPGDSSP